MERNKQVGVIAVRNCASFQEWNENVGCSCVNYILSAIAQYLPNSERHSQVVVFFKSLSVRADGAGIISAVSRVNDYILGEHRDIVLL